MKNFPPPTSYRFKDDDRQNIRALAKQLGVSQSEAIRLAVSEMLAARKGDKRNPAKSGQGKQSAKAELSN